MKRSEVHLARYKPFASAFQSRFKWRHKPSDKWRRLMDSTCFSVDWITRPSGPSMDQSSGFWTHILTPAHCSMPWNYPNYYPPTGDTRFVSKITYADTRTQVRFVTQQGDPAYKFFLSNNHTFVHSNPRLDLSVLHAEQFLKNSTGEMKLTHIQNQGRIMRPMLDIARPVQKGDVVWIYGLTAEEALFDEEKGEEPKMLPTAIRGIVHATTREQFWVDTMGEDVHMGMCGAPIIRDGKCIGMLTAKVHALSETKELAGCSMCTYATDIFEFLVEVEEQLKNGFERMDPKLTRFERQREEEAARRAAGIDEDIAGPHNKYAYGRDFDYKRQDDRIAVRGREAPFRDWDKDESRIARRVQVPLSSFRDGNDFDWTTQDGLEASSLFGPSGLLNDEVQENWGYHMNEDRDANGKPSRVHAPPREQHGMGFGATLASETRRDPSPNETIHGEDDAVVNGRVVKKQAPREQTSEEWEDIFLMTKRESGSQAAALNNLGSIIRNTQAMKAAEDMRDSAFKTGGKDNKATKAASGAYSKSERYSGDATEEGASAGDSSASKYRTDEAGNVFVGGTAVPREFVEAMHNYAVVDKAVREAEQRGSAVGGDAAGAGSAREASGADRAQQRAAEAAELLRREERKAQRAAERRRKDAAHEAALRARHSKDKDPRMVDSDTEGLW